MKEALCLQVFREMLTLSHFTALYTRVGILTWRSIACYQILGWNSNVRHLWEAAVFEKRSRTSIFPFILLFRVPLCMHSAGVQSTFIYNIAPFFIYSLLLYWDPTIGMHTLNFIFLVTTSKRNIVSNVTRQVMYIRTVLYM